MTSRVSKLVLAAVLAGTLPALAAAGDPGRPYAPDRDGRPGAVTPSPAHAPAYAPRRGPELGWRERELGQVRAERARLDAARADFHAHNAHRPGLLRGYDRRHFARRAELERRERQLERVARR